jgi:hypothetical protein
MKLLGINMPLKDLEKIYEEFSKKMDEVLTKDELKSKKSKTKS